MKRASKQALGDLHLHGGPKLFEIPISTSNLVRPDVERFLAYSRQFYDAGQYTNNGPLVQELERRLAAFHQVSHCVSFSNGFWALVLAIRCLALPSKTEAVMPSLTYRRLGDVVNWAGLVPRFCEVDERTLAISAETAAPHLGSKTALIIGVHPIVNCCDAAGLEHLAQTHSIPLLFDGVESVFETLGGRKIGSFGQAEVFSLHASKLINGFEGGYLTTNDADLAERLSAMRGFSFSGPDRVLELGTNAKLNEMHAAMALASLDDLEAQVDRNHERYRIYQRHLAGLDGIRLLTFDESEQTSYKNIVVELTEAWPLSRAQTVRHLNAEGILARAYYSPPLHSKPTDYPVIAGPMPLTERLAERYLLLPCGHLTSLGDIEAVVDFLRFLKIHSQAILEADA
ncbi:MAG TPA: aminotransferase class I/II-fold pyridoxal phosphate-dependent enzyme [Noviherbaspirillum sp.]|nr:aminotransferase class I/II-fold pyridoxal phosphate-dependent enzyme [Noviherbaspirillum sp.]